MYVLVVAISGGYVVATSVVAKSAPSSLTVSSYQMAETCVPNMMEVKRAKRSPSKMRKRRRTMVAGGEKARHSCHSLPRHDRKWLIARNSACTDISAMYICNIQQTIDLI